MNIADLKPNIIIQGAYFPEPIFIAALSPVGNSIKIMGKGMKTNSFYEKTLDDSQVELLSANPEKLLYDGNAHKYRLHIEALRLGLAYEYDPYFALSIARVDPLPHQLEAVYEYFLKLPRIRFLLADDPGAGKTIMAGLLIKELKLRGLIKRILIVTPANLTFQWQRELKDKFREDFKIIKGDILRANYGSNPWMEMNQVVTSVSWVSRMDDAKDSLLRSRWDLIIVDEAHKMSAANYEHKTLAYQLGESLSKLTDHLLLMTATPHKGDPENFRLFLELLDADVYGDVASLKEALMVQEAPFYLRRLKEALISFPDPETGHSKQLFTRREVKTVRFDINPHEISFYNDLTQYVDDQSIKASEDDSARGRALGFTMAMLQRRFASSMYAVRRSLERMRDKRKIILDDPEKYRQQQIDAKLPEDFDDLPEDEQQIIIDKLEDVVASANPEALRREIEILSQLIDKALVLEKSEVESKLSKLKEEIAERGLFKDNKMRLLIFTEHKDTLTYLVEKLRDWGLTVTQIYGGMKIGDRDTPNTRIYAEREFKETHQILVATEAAGEGINLQFCWFMINYDIPWNPVRLEQRMGRIHRYGQEKDCLILNFVSVKTREGRVLDKLFERIKKIEADLDPKQTGAVFNVLGDVFPSNGLERMIRDMYARNLTEEVITDRIIKEIAIDQFKKITHSTLEGLAKRELNLSAIIGKEAEAKERRLVPEVIEDFFVTGASYIGLNLQASKGKFTAFQVGKIPRGIIAIGEKLEPKYGRLGQSYKKIIFDKSYLLTDATLEWITPGHPLYETAREAILEITQEDLEKGAVFYSINAKVPTKLDVYSACIKDGRNHTLHERLFVIESSPEGTLELRQPTIFLDIIPSDKTESPAIPDSDAYPTVNQLEEFLNDKALLPLLNAEGAKRKHEVDIIKKHVDLSLNALLEKENFKLAELLDKQAQDPENPGLAQAIKRSDEKLDILSNRKDSRERELEQELNCSISAVQHLTSAWLLPHPDRRSNNIINMTTDAEIEKTAVQLAIEHEAKRGWIAESVEADNRGFDLISRKPHPEDPQTFIEVRFIEVKGRAGIGEIGLTNNEYRTAQRLKKDYWLYVVYNCASKPELRLINNPAELSWEAVVKIEHYHVKSDQILREGKKA